MTKQTKYRKLLLAQLIETEVTIFAADITWLMGKPLSYFDYNKLANILISKLSDTDWNTDGLDDRQKDEILEMAFIASGNGDEYSYVLYKEKGWQAVLEYNDKGLNKDLK